MHHNYKYHWFNYIYTSSRCLRSLSSSHQYYWMLVFCYITLCSWDISSQRFILKKIFKLLWSWTLWPWILRRYEPLRRQELTPTTKRNIPEDSNLKWQLIPKKQTFCDRNSDSYLAATYYTSHKLHTLHPYFKGWQVTCVSSRGCPEHDIITVWRMGRLVRSSSDRASTTLLLQSPPPPSGAELP